MDKSELAKKIKEGEFNINDSMDFFNVLCEVANNNDAIQAEVEGWDKNLLFNITDGPQITLMVQGGKFEVMEGGQGIPDVTYSMNSDVAVGVLKGETDATSAFMSGDLKVQGPLPDALKFRTLTELMRDTLED